MERAIELARVHRPHPNPRVGAVVVASDGSVVGEGAHRGPGQPHAEVMALEEAGARGQLSTVYVTLEPCVHHGRTPPCTDALVAAGVARVVVGVTDPDQRVSGRGIRQLEAAGIEVLTGQMVEAVESLDPGYFHHRRTGLPLLTLKSALTLDGQVAAADGTSQWITGEEARADAHRLRAESDAVLVGSGTVRRDDPRLDVRLPGFVGSQPRAVVVTGHGALPDDARIWERNPLIVTTGGGRGEVVKVGPDAEGRPHLGEAMAALADLGLIDVLVEGGPTLAQALWRDNLIDRGVFYFASRMAGGSGAQVFGGTWPTLGAGRDIDIVGVRPIGADLRVDWRVQ